MCQGVHSPPVQLIRDASMPPSKLNSGREVQTVKHTHLLIFILFALLERKSEGAQHGSGWTQVCRSYKQPALAEIKAEILCSLQAHQPGFQDPG